MSSKPSSDAPERAAPALDRATPARRLPGRRLLVGLLLVFLAAVVPSVVVPTLMCRQPDPVLQDLGSVGTFSLIDERAAPFDDTALYGHVTIVSMIFTRCDDICPITTAKMARLAEKTFDLGAQIKLASFSVDPAYDTPERLTEYARRFHADAARWRFITGDAGAIRKLVEGPFMDSMASGGLSKGGAPQIQHSPYFLLVDRNAHIRGAYDSNDIHKLDELVHDARYLVRTGR